MTVPHIKSLMNKSVYDTDSDNWADIDKTVVIADWDSAITYSIDDGCYYLGSVYKSLTNDNSNNLPTDENNWSQVGSGVVSEPGLYYGEPLIISETITPIDLIDLSEFVTPILTDEVTPFIVDPDTLTPLLLHFNGDSEMAEIIDSSLYPKTIIKDAPSGALLTGSRGTISTGIIWFMYATAYISLPNHSSFDFAAGDFTIECRFRLEGTGASTYTIISQNTTNSSNYKFSLQVSRTQVQFYVSYNGTSRLVGTFPISEGIWPGREYHLAIVRYGADQYCFLDGTKNATVGNLGANALYSSTANIIIGADNQGSAAQLYGSLDELRVSNIARWTESFTPPSSPYSDDANTVLLVHAEGTNGSTSFTDSSSYGHTLTPGGTYGPMLWSEPQMFGNRCLFLWSNHIKILNSPDLNFADSNFTIHFRMTCVSLPSTSQYMPLYSHCNTATSNLTILIELHNNAGTYRLSVRWSYNGSSAQQQITNYAFVAGTRYHIAVVRNGTNLVTYVDGVAIATTSIGTNKLFTQTGFYPVMIGKYYSTYGNYFKGWLDELVVRRYAEWTTNFTPPASESSP